MREIVSFLNAVQENNNRAWFAAHKMEYQKAQKRFNEFVERLLVGISEFDKEIVGWAHLYLYDDKGNLKNRITKGPWHVEEILKVDEKAP
mgnify:CR=1 FL=1